METLTISCILTFEDKIALEKQNKSKRYNMLSGMRDRVNPWTAGNALG